MNKKKKLFIITIVSIIFTLITMLIFYILSYMNIHQQYFTYLLSQKKLNYLF